MKERKFLPRGLVRGRDGRSMVSVKPCLNVETQAKAEKVGKLLENDKAWNIVPYTRGRYKDWRHSKYTPHQNTREKSRRVAAR